MVAEGLSGSAGDSLEDAVVVVVAELPAVVVVIGVSVVLAAVVVPASFLKLKGKLQADSVTVSIHTRRKTQIKERVRFMFDSHSVFLLVYPIRAVLSS